MPAIIVFVYYKIIDEEIELDDPDKELFVSNIKYKSNNGKLGLLIIQNFFFIISIIIFYKSFNNVFNKKVLFLIIFSLCFEPTLSQWHSNFFTESIFMSLLIIYISLIFNIKNNFYCYFFLGFLVGIIYLQKNLGIYLIIPSLIFLLIFNKNHKNIFILFLFIGYLIPIMFVGVHNFKRSGEFYLISKHMKIAPYHYIYHKLISEKYQINESESLKVIKDFERDWIFKNNLNLKNESDRLKFYDFKKNLFFKEAFNNPLFIIKYVAYKTLQHAIIGGKSYTKIFFKYKNKEPVWKLDEYKKILFYSILYSILIYIVSLIGLVKLFLLRKYKIIILNMILLVFFSAVLGWTGVSRYFIPSIIPIIIFFSYGFYEIFLKIKKNLILKNL